MNLSTANIGSISIILAYIGYTYGKRKLDPFKYHASAAYYIVAHLAIVWEFWSYRHIPEGILNITVCLKTQYVCLFLFNECAKDWNWLPFIFVALDKHSNLLSFILVVAVSCICLFYYLTGSVYTNSEWKLLTWGNFSIFYKLFL